ncbi:MAG: pyruvate kinase [Desulfurococcales archaeon ex4484_42]|nr:MAG: pyruvate kinase [Desulfurococcales archaeon ex4484_42]
MRTKIIASLGPSSRSRDVILGLARAGASGFRINFAHGNRGEWDDIVESVRSVEASIGKAIALIGDLRGASIRIGNLSKEVRLRRDETVRFVLKDSSDRADEIPLPNPRVFEGLEAGDLIVMDDGKVRLRVVDVGYDYALVTALTDVVIRSRKALTIRGKELDLPTLTNKDVNDLKYACSKGFNYIGLSYVRSANDVLTLKEYMRELRCNSKVIAKIETRSAVRNLKEIVEVSDAVLVARGDLGMNFGLEEIPRIQRRIIRECRRLGKPVIVATQLLESMIESPVPTRAEVSDITVAISEGVDALMLTGETAVGKYPVEAVMWLSRIVRSAEEYIEPEKIEPEGEIKFKYAKGVIELSKCLNAKIVIYSRRGTTARYIAALRPTTETYVGVPSINVARELAILWGIEPLIVEARTYEDGLEDTYRRLRDEEKLKIGDLVVMTYGMIGEEQTIKVKRVLE